MSDTVMWIIAATLIAVPVIGLARSLWLTNYYDRYNEHYADAKRRGTVGKFRCTQFPL